MQDLKPILEDLATRLSAANEARLDGKMTRPAHAVIVAEVGEALEDLGVSWDVMADLMAEMRHDKAKEERR
jgi:hypothetical protein